MIQGKELNTVIIDEYTEYTKKENGDKIMADKLNEIEDQLAEITDQDILDNSLLWEKFKSIICQR